MRISSTSFDWQIFTALDVPVRDIYQYVFEDIDFPSEYDDRYLSFIYSIVKYGDDKVIQGLKDWKCFPTMSKKLKKITDLHDYNNNFFQKNLKQICLI